MSVKLNLVGGEGQIQYPEKRGDAIIVNNKDHISLVWCCPQCGQATATARGHKHVYNPETKSLTPSIVHNKKLGGCGYHGFLTNGIFTNVIMNVIKLYGGLGNQMFQYAFGLAMQNNGIDVSFETSFFHKDQKPPRPYRLDKYGIEIKISPFLNQPIIHEQGYMPELLKKNNVNLFGYWQYLHYYETVWDQIRKTFQVSEKYYTEEYLKLKERITKTESLSVHVRRGDYVSINGHILLPFSYYMEAVNLISKAEEIFVFSDDLPWCREKFKESYFGKPITFVDVEEYLAMELMRLCKNNIIANSTFSWWAAMLTNNTFQAVIAPKIWRVNPVEQAKMEDGSFIPTNWTRL